MELVRGTTAYELRRKLEHMFNYIGYPKVIVSDNGPPFTSQEFIEWCKQKGIIYIRSPLYHPQSNGLAERAVQEMKSLLKKQISPNETVDWSEKVKEIQRDVRFAGSETLMGKSPAQIIYSYDSRTRFNNWHNQLVSSEVESERQNIPGDENVIQIGS